MSEPTTENYVIKESLLKKAKIPPGSRKVLVKILNKITDRKTKSGIIMISPTETDWNPARHRNRVGIVMAVPKDPLPFKVGADLMPWETNVELMVGMMVWVDFMNMETINDEHGNEYKLVDYASCYVATTTSTTEGITPLNGFHIFERVYKKQRGRFDIFETQKVDRRRGVVKYVAKNNKQYETKGQSDHVDLEVGDEVQFGQVPEVMLEDETYCSFDGGKMYRRAQARNIDLVWRNGELILPRGRCLIKQIPDEKILPSGLILLRENVKNHRGTVVLSSMEEVKEGDTVKYILNGGTPMRYKDENCRVLTESHILYVE